MNAPELAFWGFSAIAALTYFFSSRRRLFVRVFVPPEELRSVLRGLPRDPEFKRSMRTISLLQFAFASVFGLVGLWQRFR